jgi:hypothetical protein
MNRGPGPRAKSGDSNHLGLNGRVDRLGQHLLYFRACRNHTSGPLTFPPNISIRGARWRMYCTIHSTAPTLGTTEVSAGAAYNSPMPLSPSTTMAKGKQQRSTDSAEMRLSVDLVTQAFLISSHQGGMSAASIHTEPYEPVVVSSVCPGPPRV